MSMSPVFRSGADPEDYADGRTKQSYKDQTDISKILARAARGESISHLEKHGATYGDFSDIGDLMVAYERLQAGTAIFNELPGELRREFNNSPAEFFEFVNMPENTSEERRRELMTKLAQPGDQHRSLGAPPEPPEQPAAAPPAGTPAEPPPAA